MELSDCVVWTVVIVRVLSVSVRVHSGGGIVRLCCVDFGQSGST